MKKIITALLAGAMLLSVSACGKADTNAAQTTAATDAVEVKAITIDEINGIIDAVKKEYAEADEIKLSDGTVISAAHKNPGITIDDVKNGTATSEQKNDYVIYMANVRQIVYDRLSTAYGEGNCVIIEEEGKDPYAFIFPDPKADGYDDAKEALSAINIVGKDSGSYKALTGCVYTDSKSTLYYEKNSASATLLCPTAEENALLTEIMK